MRRTVRMWLGVLVLGSAVRMQPGPPAQAVTRMTGGSSSQAQRGVEPIWAADSGGWQGSGALVLPNSTSPGPAGPSDQECRGCQWSVVPVCQNGGRQCELVPPWASCPQDSQRFAIWFAQSADEALQLHSSACLNPNDRPLSVVELGRLVADRVSVAAPPVAIEFQPARGAITQLPTIFRSGQRPILVRHDSIAGYDVQFRATAQWRWIWGDGSITNTSRPGGTWPDTSLTHTYTSAGLVKVECETSWRAEFWVDGEGPFVVSGQPVTQQSSRRFKVRQAKAVLVVD